MMRELEELDQDAHADAQLVKLDDAPEVPECYEDITPEGSVTPVYYDPTPPEPIEPPTEPEPDPALVSALAKLTALGLTEDEARALAGGGA